MTFVIERLRARTLAAFRSSFGRDVAWITVLSAAERTIAVVQTILIARVLGITEYGVYGFLFGTIGLVASILGLQMGLTATVFVARFRASEKSRAAAVISIARVFGWTTALAFVLCVLPFGEAISRFLLQSSEFQIPLMVAIVFIGATIVSGVQDGVAQGFEMFGAVAKLKILVAAATLLSIYPAATYGGLTGVLAAILAGLALKCIILRHCIARSRDEFNIPRTGSGVSVRELVSGFAIPSMAISLGTGFLMWLGTLVLTRQPAGFDQVAVVNTGLQWRAALLLLAMSIGTVAVPAFSRLDAQGDTATSVRLRRDLVATSAAVAIVFTAVLALASEGILRLYGPDFVAGRLVFCLILLSSVPTAITNVYMHQLVGTGRMWKVFWLHCPHFVIWLACIVLLVPKYQALGFAAATLISIVVLMACTIALDQLSMVRTGRGSGDPRAGDSVNVH